MMLTTRIKAYGALVLLVVAALASAHWEGVRQGRAQAEIHRLEQRMKAIEHERDLAIDETKKAVADAIRIDSIAHEAAARYARSQGKVTFVRNTDTVTIQRDTGKVVVAIPPEVAQRLRDAESLLATQQAQITARDTVISKLEVTVRADSALLIVKDSTIDALKHRPSKGKGWVVAGTATVTTVVLGIITHLVK